ncbi:hypothetical protein QYE76_028029 [Lolium multiflorum]|uniref:Uncharacterized protein n=1 Tax=Lolium multiflorum TaxID=4521 RepID=A0AAD8VGL7_LOLMU|nr:hypothetical protein QYE76_028029 [Lolium multiflorum]
MHAVAIKCAAALRDARAARTPRGVPTLQAPPPSHPGHRQRAPHRLRALRGPRRGARALRRHAPELRDAVSYNSPISAPCLFSRWAHALDALRAMLAEARHGVSSFTLVSVLLACSHLPADADHRLGREAHTFALKNGFLDHGRERFPFNALLSISPRGRSTAARPRLAGGIELVVLDGGGLPPLRSN